MRLIVHLCSLSTPFVHDLVLGLASFPILRSMANILLTYLALDSAARRNQTVYATRRGTGPRQTREMRQIMVPPRKILLVDDSETILQMEQMILANNAYEIITARDGEEGVAKALKNKPDLILMDVVMPKMNGFEAVRHLRENPKTRTVPIVMVTSKAEAESMEAGYVSGCNDYIIKPIDSLELLTKVKNLIGE